MRIVKKTHAQRMKLVEKLCAEVKTALGEGLKAFCVYGPVATNDEGPYGDLELMAISIDDFECLETEFIRDGIKVWIKFIPFHTAVKKAQAINYVWPFTAHQWHRFLPIYVQQGDDCLQQTQTAAREALKADEKFRKHLAARARYIYEDVCKLRNAKEADSSRDLLAVFNDFEACLVLLVSFANRCFYSSYLNAYEESKELANLPSDYVQLIEMVNEETEVSLKTRYDAALELWENVKDWLADMGIDWEKKGKLEFPKKVEG